ncbi:MAG: sugar phosphorylase, partial [Enterobacter sp.]|nr:sugar phosphorylase [Enterobacter sp.]
CALEDKNSLRYQVYSALGRLIVLRRAEKAFHPDSEAYFSTSGKHVLKIVRVADCGEKITALFNFSDNSQTVESDIHSGRELISGKDITDTTLILNPWQVLWIKEN